MCPTEDGPVMKNEVSAELYCWYTQETLGEVSTFARSRA